MVTWQTGIFYTDPGKAIQKRSLVHTQLRSVNWCNIFRTANFVRRSMLERSKTVYHWKSSHYRHRRGPNEICVWFECNFYFLHFNNRHISHLNRLNIQGRSRWCRLVNIKSIDWISIRSFEAARSELQIMALCCCGHNQRNSMWRII